MTRGGSIRLLALSVALSAAAASCSRPGNAGSGYEILPAGEGWCYSDTLAFPIAHTDSMAAGRVAVGVTHTGEYPFSDLWIEITSTDGEGAARRDTVRLLLADRNGRWTGNGIGTSFQVADTVDAPLVHRSGSPITVRHIMRDDTVPGIDRVGVFFIPAD